MNNFLYLYKLKKSKKVILGKNVKIGQKNIFEGFNKIDSFSRIFNCYLGKYSYIGESCDFREIKIGRYCSFGARITCVLGQHPLNFISTHPFCYQKGIVLEKDIDYKKNSDLEEKFKSFAGYKIIVENDVWIGNNVTIFSGVTIHTGAIIGSGAVVTKDVPPYAIVAGVPAKIIKYRFEEEIIEKLLESKWWLKDCEELKKHKFLFNNPKEFLEKFTESREQRAESREQRAESREQRAESREQRAESNKF